MKKTSKLATILLGLSLLGTPTPVNTSSNLFEKGRIEEASLERKVNGQPDLKKVYSYNEVSKIVHDVYRSAPRKPDYLTEDFLREIIMAESEYNARAESKKGAKGLMQLMPDAWDDVEKNRSYDNYALDPRTNLEVGMKYLLHLDKSCKNHYEKWEELSPEEKRKIILASYNGGPLRLAEMGWNINTMPVETKDYVRKISEKVDN